MTVSAQFQYDIICLGAILGPKQIDYPVGSIIDVDISASAAISASKSEKSLHVAVGQSGTATTETELVRVVKGTTGTLKHFTASNLTASAGASNVTVDLQNNGVSVLNAVITLDAATGDLGEAVGVITSPALADGDVLSVVITANAVGTPALATGVLAQVDWDEDYAA